MVEEPVEDLTEGVAVALSGHPVGRLHSATFTRSSWPRLQWFGGGPGIQRDANLVVEPPLSRWPVSCV
jgi:hypothetical protein